MISAAGVTYTGSTGGAGTALTGTTSNGGTFAIPEPNTTQVFDCNGPLAQTPASSPGAILGALICGALNRGVALEDPDSTWDTPADFYQAAPYNVYSAFFHTINIGGAAYGFPYDDTGGQSSTSTLPNTQPPTSVTLSVGW